MFQIMGKSRVSTIPLEQPLSAKNLEFDPQSDSQSDNISGRLCFILKENAEQSTVHGIANIARTRNRFLQIIWLICLLASSAYCVYTIILAIQDYLSYPVVSNMQIVNELPTEFPTIMLCNINPICTDSEFVVDSLNNFILPDDELDISENLTAAEYSRQNSEIIKMLGFQNYEDTEFRIFWSLDQMLISCTYGGASCDSSDFEQVYVYDYVNCYRFNSNGKVATSRIGSDNGLQLELYIGNGSSPNDFNYMSNRGIRYMITNYTLNNKNIYDLGYDAPPGRVTNVEIRKNYYNKLGPPYSDCLSDLSPQSSSQTSYMKTMFEKLNQTKYNQIYCQDLCFQLEIIKNCKCYSWGYPFANETYDGRYLDGCLPESFDCMFDSIYNITNNPGLCVEQCPSECEWHDFETLVTTSDYMSHWYWNYQKAYASRFQLNRYDYFDSPRDELFWKLSQMTFDTARNSTLKIIFYLNHLGYTFSTESPFHSPGSLLATIGGNMGLFIGLSILSVVEFFELAYRIVEFLVIQSFKGRFIKNSAKEKGVKRINAWQL